MKKIFGVALVWILVSTTIFAQEATVEKVDLTEKAKTCVPTKECAEKAGMTLEECKKICSGKAAATASTTNVASASLVADTEAKGKKCCASIKECAAKSGMTVAECKAKCTGQSKTAMEDSSENKETKVAAAALVNEVEAIPVKKAEGKKCCKSAKACTKKKE